MKNQLLPTVVLLLLSIPTFSQNNYVQIGVYDRQVPAYQFTDLNERIYHGRDAYDFHRYYIGPFDDATATSKAAALRTAGRHGVEVVPDAGFGANCCSLRSRPREITARLRSIFFDFDRYSLRPESRQRLDQLVKTLRENPEYRTRLMAHTDGKGSDDYNVRLSINRANAAKKYLQSRGIASSRIDTQTFGETNPIAKNELANGQDTEAGRQFNRRVELLLINAAGEVMNVVEEIDVPAELRM